ncbi:hypothetical protein HAX54_039904 [Datura stramonium]|uniref:Uncharacterized protein n=1 Tax=Datura stramonium TaxID=4076 RepID=A0ABS8VRJ7_DATST|nr:hypothetical protein [Datura stramonium]
MKEGKKASKVKKTSIWEAKSSFDFTKYACRVRHAGMLCQVCRHAMPGVSGMLCQPCRHAVSGVSGMLSLVCKQAVSGMLPLVFQAGCGRYAGLHAGCPKVLCCLAFDSQHWQLVILNIKARYIRQGGKCSKFNIVACGSVH